MGTVIAVNGKGGTGKTTIAALFIALLVRQKSGSVLAIDADPNSCLAESLGLEDAETIVGLCEEISGKKDKIPAGMTKDRYIEMRVQESLTEGAGFDLLAMGRPEGPGCYCYVNNLLRNIIDRITKNYDFVVIDNAAGMEHISRRTMGEIQKLVLVSDYSVAGIRSAKKIYALAKSLGIKISGAYLIINKVSGPLKALADETKGMDFEIAGSIPYDEELVRWNISDKPIFEFRNRMVEDEIREVFSKLMKVSYAGRAG